MLVREAKEPDLPAVLEVLREIDRENGLSLEKAAETWRVMQQYPYYRVFVAETEGRVVGTFSLLVCENLGHGGARIALVDSVAVLPEYQGRGIGKSMVKKAMEKAAEKGSYKLMLSSNISREQAHRFYKQLGFEAHGISFTTGLL